ncbi:hypothetical protein GJ744_001745 [Endocarpon pusillum]|uniref:Uncharacterized protein n=1 Tax=Endocarpon pusillum TaxID=364733 RepID=A0A8H7DZ77_9EURO|nr:hypothetical protein GJ744_001745 [Endocarpon pusillum]
MISNWTWLRSRQFPYDRMGSAPKPPGYLLYDSVWRYGRRVEGGSKWVYGRWAGKGTVAKFELQSEVIVDGTIDFPEDEAGVETREMVAGEKHWSDPTRPRYRVGG